MSLPDWLQGAQQCFYAAEFKKYLPGQAVEQKLGKVRLLSSVIRELMWVSEILARNVSDLCTPMHLAKLIVDILNRLRSQACHLTVWAFTLDLTQPCNSLL